MGRLYIISGDDDFSVKERTRSLIGELSGSVPEDDPALEIISGDRDDVKKDELLGNFLAAMRTPPFLTDHKIVWLKHCKMLEEFFADDAKGALAEVAAILSSPLDDELTVVIDGPGWDSRRTLAKAVKKTGAEVEIHALVKSTDKNFGENRRDLIKEICNAAGKKISYDAIQYLIDTIGPDNGVLKNELDKLMCYAWQAPEITLRDCEAICSRTNEAVSWEFSGAVVAGKTTQSLQLLDILLKQGEPEVRIMAILSSEFQKMIQLKLAMQELNVERVNPRTFDRFGEADKAKYPNNMLLKLHPYRAFKMCENAANFPDAKLVKALDAIRDASRALVSGGGESRIILEQLILSLTGKI